jgi:hypothetical protein
MSQQISFETFSGSAAANDERCFVPAIGAPLAADLVELASLRPSDRVLDVACGTGVVARHALDRVGAARTPTSIRHDLDRFLAFAPGTCVDTARSSATGTPTRPVTRRRATKTCAAGRAGSARTSASTSG